MQIKRRSLPSDSEIYNYNKKLYFDTQYFKKERESKKINNSKSIKNFDPISSLHYLGECTSFLKLIGEAKNIRSNKLTISNLI